MNTSLRASSSRGFVPTLALVAALILGLLPISATSHAQALPSQSKPYGQSYAQWSAAWWQWLLGRPLVGHPSIDSPDFDVTGGQSGTVWFLAAPFGTVERTIAIPHGKALFIGLIGVEASSLEEPPFYGATEPEQQAIATGFADFIVDVSCSVDGNDVPNINQYRFLSPQYTFTAPTPWLFGATGGTGTSVADGYYVMLAPLATGSHTIHFSGAFKFSDAPEDFIPLDMTYYVTVQ